MTIYEHGNPATSTMLHVITLKREGGRVIGSGKLIPKTQGDNSLYPNAEYTNFNYDEKYFNECYKLYKGGREYRSEWSPKEVAYNVPREGGRTWGGP